MSAPSEGGWRPRLVALDIDGTVVDHDGRLPGEVRDAVQRVAASGVPVVLATGRSWHGTRPVADELGLPAGPMVCSNGAVVIDYPSGTLRRMITFDPAPVLDRVAELAPQALVAVEELGRGYRVSGEFPPGDLTGDLVSVSLDELRAEPVTRVIIRDPASDDEAFVRLAQQLGLHEVSYFIGWSAWLDIAPQGVDKASGLADVVAALDLTAGDVLALGDGRNDIEMLTWAGRGVALGDAPDEVRRSADAVTGRFDDGGTVAELDRWFG